MKRAEGKELLKKKVDDFYRTEKQYLNKSFGETETRDRFIDPFFRALGWDFDQTNISRHFWDVHREYAQKNRSQRTKKPDYAFRYKGKEKFYVEAKAPHVDLDAKDPVFQAKRYAFSSNGKAPIVILTDFEEFRVFNALERPIFDNPRYGLIKKFDLKYKQYLDHWDSLYENFSKEAVSDGSIAKLIGKIQRNAKTLDREFLADLTSWREMLAKRIAIDNEKLTVEQINECVQRILDRLIFIRNLEDREIEPAELLNTLTKSTADIYPQLLPIFRNMDSQYNGLIFKEHLSDKIEVDSRVLKDIIKRLYPNLSPYRFDIIEPELLGRIYEKFLGSKIRLTSSHRAKIEEKPEVRHAGGVYYTPEWVVNYIVENTVGKIVKGKNPKEIKEIKILDPACGSGSFLLGAFSYLITYHELWYEKNPKKYKDDFYLDDEENIRLRLHKKSEILKNNIFGVDIDREATEVAIMSLYLKLLEQGYDQGQTEIMGRGFLLPDMVENIKCGNSLIDRTMLFETDMFGDEDILPFDWQDEKNGFGKVFKEQGGFDAIIGNPPYIKTQELQNFAPKQTEMYKSNYHSSSKGNLDIYIIFIEKSLHLLNKFGKLGFICPHKFFNSNYGENIRSIIAEGKYLEKILHLGINQVFENATTYTCLLFLSKELKRSLFHYFELKQEVKDIEPYVYNAKNFEEIDINNVGSQNWVFTSSEISLFNEKFLKNKPTLEEITTNIFQGPKSGADPVFIFKLIQKNEKTIKGYSANLEKEFSIENSIIRKYVKGKYIKRYDIQYSQEYIIYPYNKEGELYSEKTLKTNFPLAYQYLSQNQNKKILLSREKGRFKKIWWSYSRPQNMKILNLLKVITPFNAFRSSFSLDTRRDFIFSAGVSGAYGILLKPEINIHYEYLLGILNSSLMDIYLKNISTALRGGFYSYENKYIKKLPIYIPDPSDKAKYKLTQKIEKYAKDILAFKKTDKDADADFLEKKIDEMVAELYGVEE